MVTQINFGQINTVNGKTVLTGSQSGLDTNALINTLATAKALPATQDQTKITANQAKITAYTSLQTALTTLQTSLDALRNPTANSSATNAFTARTPFLTVDNSNPVSNYAGVATNAGAPIGNYILQVSRLATAETDQSTSFSDRTSSVVGTAGTNTSGQFAAGTFQINGVNVTLSAGSSLNNVAAAINSQSANTNVTANIVEISANSYQLQLTGTKTGQANAITITDTSHVLPYTTNPDTSTTQNMFTVTQAAQDSLIQFGTTPSNLQTIDRSTNQISDLLDDTTISLYGVTSGATISLAIDKDDSSIATAVGNFVTAYNAVRTFQAQQTQVDATTGQPVTTAVLNNDSTMNTIINELATLVSGQASISIPSLYSSGTVTAPTRMGDLGITMSNVAAGTDANGNPTPAVTNTLNLDTTTLETNLESYFDDVSNIFEFQFTASSPDLGIFQRDNTVTNANFGIAIDTTQPVGSQAKITSIDGSALATPLDLNYKTTTTEQSSNFTDTTSSVVNAGGTNTAGAFAAGTFSLNGTSVTLTQGESLTDVANDINNANTGVTANIVSNGSGYNLTLSGTDDGTNGVVISDPDGVLPTPSMFTVQSSVSQISGPAGTDLSNFNFAYNGDGSETINEASPLSSKDFTMAVTTTIPSGSTTPVTTANVTQIFGQTLATPIALQYTAEGSSASINGVAGTAFSGLQMVYTGTGNDPAINVSMSQGIGDQLYNSVSGILSGINGSTGILTQAMNTLTDTDTTLQTQITSINSQVTDYRNQLLTKFSQLEAAISSANSILSLLSAQDDASLENSGH